MNNLMLIMVQVLKKLAWNVYWIPNNFSLNLRAWISPLKPFYG